MTETRTSSAVYLDEESKKLYDLVRYAGITIDPGLFKNMIDLLKEGKNRRKPDLKHAYLSPKKAF